MDFLQVVPRVIALSWLALSWAVAAPAAPAPLTTAAAVLSLDGEHAGRRLPVAVSGIVTAAEADWTGQFFIQDETAGVFVENIGASGPQPGDIVTLTGVSHPGAFAPIISAPVWKKIGTAPLPPAKPVLVEDLESGLEDGQRLEITGVVRTAQPEETWLNIDLAVGGYRLQVRAPREVASAPNTLIGARVRIRGTAATHYNAALRHLTAVAVYVPRAEDFTVVAAELADPFGQPVIPLNNVAQYRRDSAHVKRVHVRGLVTLQRLGEDVFLQDDSGGIRIVNAERAVFAPGDPVDAVGFLEYENFLPVIRDASLRQAGPRQAPPRPRTVLIPDIKYGLHHADVITLRGKILDRSTRPVSRDLAHYSGYITTWLIQGDGLGYTIECEHRREDDLLATAPVGSVVEVDGVCFSEIDTAGKLKTLRLLLTGPQAMRVLDRPSWLTPQRLLVGLGLLGGLLVLAVGWTLTVSKKNTALNDTLHALEKAQRELQEAHDTLEQKVIERSAQLQTEMTARKTAEVQFKAVLAERTRLARDLHDTLEQTLTGIGLQLDTAVKLFQRSPEASNHHLALALNWLRQSQVELRRSIWDLRSRELEQFDLANALRRSAEHLVDGSDVSVEFATRGEKRPLPEVVEENVLRIGQEALTNVAKHARATRIAITLDFAPAALRLRIEDNGIGFVHPLPASGENHYGLIGMEERAKRLSGLVTVDAAPGRGTAVSVEIPLPAASPAPPPAGDGIPLRIV